MSLTSIVDTSYKVPRAFVKVSLGAGPRSPGSAAMSILLIGSKTSSGSAAVGTKQLLVSKDDAKTYFGTASELHLMATSAFAAYPAATIYAIALDDSTGGGLATKTVAFTGTATADGTFSIWINGKKIVVGVLVGDTATVVGDKVVAAVAGQTDCPMTGVNTTGSIAFSSRNKGARFNYLSVRTQLVGATGIAHTPVTGYAAGGTDTGADPTVTLGLLAAERFHLIVCPFIDATNIAKFGTFCTAQLQPLIGRRERFIASLPTSLASSITIADTVNNQLGELVLHRNPDCLPAQIAAAMAALIVSVRSSDRAYNTDGLLVPGIPVQNAQADFMLESESNSALNNGLTPLVSRNGNVYIVREVTSYHKDGSGNPDFSVLDTHYVDVPIYIADAIEQQYTQVFAGFKLAPDNSDGEPPAAKVATPSSIKDWLFSILKAQEGKLLVRTEELKASLVVEIDPDAVGRANAEVPVDVIELFHQLAANVSQVG